MCLLAWNWQPDSATPLVLLSNRDEYFERPTQNLRWWPGNHILAGKDARSGGTWLGVNRLGHMAAVTNYRLPTPDNIARPSRGALVTAFLETPVDAQSDLSSVVRTAAAFNPFNLLVYDGHHLLGLESRSGRIIVFAPGPGAVSNADFNTPWPKLERLQRALQSAVNQPDGVHATVRRNWQSWLQDRTVAPDHRLPNTGIPRNWERVLSSIFVPPTGEPRYGTRSSCLLRIDHSRIEFCCQRHTPYGPGGQHQFQFSVAPH